MFRVADLRLAESEEVVEREFIALLKRSVDARSVAESSRRAAG